LDTPAGVLAAEQLDNAGLAGTLPAWQLAVHAAVEHPAQPQVRAAFAAAFARTAH